MQEPGIGLIGQREAVREQDQRPRPRNGGRVSRLRACHRALSRIPDRHLQRPLWRSGRGTTSGNSPRRVDQGDVHDPDRVGRPGIPRRDRRGRDRARTTRTLRCARCGVGAAVVYHASRFRTQYQQGAQTQGHGDRDQQQPSIPRQAPHVYQAGRPSQSLATAGSSPVPFEAVSVDWREAPFGAPVSRVSRYAIDKRFALLGAPFGARPSGRPHDFYVANADRTDFSERSPRTTVCDVWRAKGTNELGR